PGQMVQASAVRAAQNDAVIGPRQDQQRERCDQQQQGDAVEITRPAWQMVERRLEDAAELKADQDLDAEHQHARFVERNLDLLAEIHGGETAIGTKSSRACVRMSVPRAPHDLTRMRLLTWAARSSFVGA